MIDPALLQLARTAQTKHQAAITAFNLAESAERKLEIIGDLAVAKREFTTAALGIVHVAAPYLLDLSGPNENANLINSVRSDMAQTETMMGNLVAQGRLRDRLGKSADFNLPGFPKLDLAKVVVGIGIVGLVIVAVAVAVKS